jgi:excisionase family DNA binding protein
MKPNASNAAADIADLFAALADMPTQMARMVAANEALTQTVARALNTMPRRLAKLNEAAAYYGVSYSTMRRLVKEGLIKSEMVGKTPRVDISGPPQLDQIMFERLARKAAMRMQQPKQQKDEKHGTKEPT